MKSPMLRMPYSLVFGVLLLILPVTTARGQNWVQTSRKDVADVAVMANDAICVTTRDGNFAYSLDNGKSYNPGRAGLRRIASAGQTIWAVAIDGSVCRSDDGVNWTQSSATGMEDIAAAPNGEIACTEAGSGAVWISSNGRRFQKDAGTSDFSRVSYDPQSNLWAAGSNGSLWKRKGGQWEKTVLANMQDVAAGPQGGLWLTDRGGNVWYSNWGEAPIKVPGAGFENIAVARSGIAWVAGKNGTLWYMDAQHADTSPKPPSPIPSPKPPVPPSAPPKPPAPPAPKQFQAIKAVNLKPEKGFVIFSFETVLPCVPNIVVATQGPDSYGKFVPKTVRGSANGVLGTKHQIRVNIPTKGYEKYVYRIKAQTEKKDGTFTSAGTFDP